MRLVALFMLLSLVGGCANMQGWDFFKSWNRPAPRSVSAQDSELGGLADLASRVVAEQYPPGRTVLFYENSEDSDFAVQLETSLRRYGFTLSDQPAPGILRVASTLDSLGVRPDGSELWYLHVRCNDGFSFGQVYTLTPQGFYPAGAMTRTNPSAEVRSAHAGFNDVAGSGVAAHSGHPDRRSPGQSAQFAAASEEAHGADTVLPPFMSDARMNEAHTTLAAHPVEASSVIPASEEWRIQPGSLRNQLTSWCDRQQYQLIWLARNDYSMQANAIFRDSFQGAVQSLFARMHQSGNGLRVRLYPDNRVLEVMED